MKRIIAVLLLLGSLVAICGCEKKGEALAPTDTEPTEYSAPATEHVHSYQETEVASTATVQGYTRYVCAGCGHSYDEPLPADRLDAVYSGAIKDYLLPFEDFSRERVAAPEFVMIHFTSAVVLSQKDPYNMEKIRSTFVDYEVSVHYIIQRDGTVRCYIPENLVAWHAGKGTWKNDPKYTDKLNDYAIGIEVVAIGSQKDMKQYLTASVYKKLDKSLIGYTDAQYDALRVLVKDICQRNEIPMDREHIIGHQEYASRKSDPGELFDWERLLS